MNRSNLLTVRGHRRRTAALMAGCSLAAVLALSPQVAAAQAFAGTPTAVYGSPTFTDGAGVTTIGLKGSETVINWTPTDKTGSGTIDFLPNGNFALFDGPVGYTVLNRVLPVDINGNATARMIGLNGRIASTTGRITGGNVWFYTPTGFVVGPTATITAGGLILTTNDVVIDPANTGGTELYGPGNTVMFRGPAGSKGLVDVQAGSQIAATSYVALVAPRVQQGGLISADGPIGYVGAEQADISINAGLFDISILAGTTDANGVVHTGTTTGSASTGYYSDPKQIYFAAVPKNDALTMLLSGSIGYAPASNVYDDGSAIVLSAGAAGSPDGNISIGNASFANRLNASATGSIAVAPTAGDAGTGAAGGTTSFANYTGLSGAKSVTLTADHGSKIITTLGISLNSSDLATGGKVTVEALGASGLSPAGQMTFNGGLYATAGATGTGSAAIGGDGRGGSVTLAANGGTITADYISLDAGANGEQGQAQGGEAHGGSVLLSAGYGGSITSGSASLYATGRGGSSYNPEGPTGYGGDGFGGSIALHDFGTELGADTLGGTLALGNVYLNASADGGYTYDIGAGHGGNAFGGTIDIALNRRNQTFSSLYANADAHDGDTSIDPTGGTVNMTVGGGITVNVTSDMNLTANAVAGVNGGPGAIGSGGTVNLTVNGGATLGVSGSFYGQARADVAVPFDLAVDSSPDLIGGAVNVLASGGTFHARDIYIDVGASNIGAGTLAGSATGGTVSLGADNGGSLYTASISGVGGFFNVLANGEGSNGAKANVARGGTVNLFANNGGTVTAFGSTIEIGAAAGDDSYAPDTSGVGVDAFGGTVNIDALGGTIQSGVDANVTGSGGSADGDAGDGAAGEVHVRSLGGTLTGLLNVSAEGNGGQSLVAGDGGDGRGGNLTLLSDAAATYAGFELDFLSESAGGAAAAGTGGDGYGGRAQIDVLGGTHTWTSVFLRGDSYGAPSLGAGSLGGSAFGDPAGLNFHVGGGSLTLTDGLTFNASASSGDNGGPLGQAVAGSAALTVDGGGSLTTPSIYAYASAYGYFGDAFGGKGTGGTISFAASNGGTISTPFLGAYADAQGGGSNATGGDAAGGSITLQSTNGVLDLSSIDFIATAYAGYGESAAGTATGGKASIVLDRGLYNWNNVSADVDAHAGNSGAQGNAASGLVDAIDLSLLNGAALSVAGNIDLSSNAFGTFNAPAGATVRGGGINLSVSGGSSLAFGNLTANSGGFIDVPFSFFGPAPDTTPDTFGGTINLTADGGSLSGRSISLLADAENFGAASAAGTATGGTVNASFLNGSSLTLFSGEGGGDSTFSATGHGAIGQSAANAVGGQVTLTVSDSTVTTDGAIDLLAAGEANNIATFYNSGVDPVGFNATGGTATLNLLAGTLGTASLSARDLVVDASGNASTPEFYYPGCCETIESGYYGGPMSANGGVGTGGTAMLNLAGGGLFLTTASVKADGSGGASAESGSGTPFRSGDGHGGTAAMTVSGGTGTITDLSVTALGIGGDGSSTGAPGTQPSLAGDGYGGSASLTFTGGTLTADALTIDADGTGGVGGDGPDDSSPTPGSDGGNGTGGTASLISTAGSTGQLTAPTISLTAIGTGGAGGQSAGGSQGNGGDGIGGTVAADLADGAFAIGPLNLVAEGRGGDGEIGGVGSGGIAKFLVNDSTAGPSGDRTIAGLQLSASGAGGFGTDGGAQSDAGLALLTLNATGLLTIDGDLGVSVEGARSAAGDGFIGAFSGTPVHVTGNTAIYTTRDATITATTPLQLDGDLQITARKLSGTGQFAAGGFVAINADQGIALDKVSAGTTTSLQATNGAILVATDLESGGNVTAVGRSIDITSLGALNFATAQATAGNLRVATIGNLTLGTPLVTGAVDLSSSSGAVTVTGALNSGGNASVSGNAGVSLATLAAGGTATLTSANGTIGASGDVSSVGAFSASGRNGVTFGKLTSGGATSLTSSNGSVTVSGALASAGNATVSGNSGVSLATLTAGGSATLSSANGTIGASGDVSSVGAFSASGRGNVTFGKVTSGGATSLTSSNGSVTVSGALSVGTDATVSGNSGVSLATLTAGGSATLSSANGTIGASGDVSSVGAFSASGRGNVTFDKLTSGGATSLTSSNGAVTVSGALASAGDAAVSGNTGVSLATLSAGGTGTLASANGTIAASGNVSSAGAFSASGRNGVAFGNLTSGGTTLLNSSNGAITVTNLTSPGLVTAVGASVTLNSSSPLSFANAQATAGNLAITTPGNLTFAQASATGTIGISSSAGSLLASGPITAGGAVNLFGSSGLTLDALASGGTTLINGGSGALKVASLTSAGAVTALGASIDITSPGALTFASFAANSGPASISTSGNLTIADGNATGNLTLASANGAISSTGTVTAGGAVALNGKTGIDFNRLNSGGTTALTSASGPIHIVRLASAGLVTANGGSIDIGSVEGLNFDTVNSTGAVSVVAAGDLAFNSVNAGSTLTLNSTGGKLTTTGAVTGGATSLSSLNGITIGGDLKSLGDLAVDTRGAFVANGGVQTAAATIVADTGITLGAVQTGGLTHLTASNGNIRISDLNAGGAVSAVGLGVDIASNGSLTFDVARATQDNLTIRAGGDLNAQTLFANRDMSLTARSTFGLTGDARAVNIAVNSTDIALAAGSQLGARGTTKSLKLSNTDGERLANIGGAAGAGGYDLDSAEVGRLFADSSISLGSSGNIVVGSLQLTYGATGNIGSGGTLEVTTPSQVSIVGDVKLTTANEADRFIIDPTRVELNTDTGSIAMLDASGNPLGRLQITGDTIALGTGNTLGQLRGLTDMAAIKALLDAPGGRADPLRAGGLTFNVVDGLFIQNSGSTAAVADRRGFRANTVDIFTQAATKIVINGVILQNGTAVTGADTVPLVMINEKAATAGGSFDALSTINGCVIGAACLPPPPPELEVPVTPTPDDDLTPPVTPDDPGDGIFAGVLVSLEANEPLITPPLVDEPITGVGNDDLWLRQQCTDPKQEGCPQQDSDK